MWEISYSLETILLIVDEGASLLTTRYLLENKSQNSKPLLVSCPPRWKPNPLTLKRIECQKRLYFKNDLLHLHFSPPSSRNIWQWYPFACFSWFPENKLRQNSWGTWRENQMRRKIFHFFLLHRFYRWLFEITYWTQGASSHYLTVLIIFSTHLHLQPIWRVPILQYFPLFPLNPILLHANFERFPI